MPTILIAGGTGLLGTRLSKLLRERNYHVLHLSRKRNLSAEYPAYQWDLDKKLIEVEALEQTDFIINLAGAAVADARWTPARKKLIIESRVNSTLLFKSFIEEKRTPAKAFISASAIGYYGNRGEQLLKENDPSGAIGFLPKSVVAWEKSIDAVADTGIRTVAFRIGIVLSTKGGALQKMLLPFRFFNGTYFGNGSMFYSWIHIDDMARMFVEAIENEQYSGYYNGVAPAPATNKKIVLNCKEALGKPAILTSAPAFLLRAVMGEMADMILDSTRVSAEKVQSMGFQFQFPELLPAIKDLLERKM